MGRTPTPVSPKVTSSTVTAAAATVTLYVLAQVPFVAAMPAPVQAAGLVLLTAAATFVAGYIKRDPRRH